jgi:hypothetical protein
MKLIRRSALLVVPFVVGATLPAHAVLVPAQKGSACSAVFDTGTALATAGNGPKAPWRLTCADGDPTCDRDGLQNGTCSIQINGCANVTAIAGCTPEALTKVTVNGVIKNKLIGFAPISVGQNGCGVPGTISLNLKGKKKNKKSKPATLIVNFKTTKKGQNRLKVQCTPPGTSQTGASCPKRSTAGFPSQLTLMVPQQGTDLDNGWTGASHNFPVIFGSSLKYCLDGCDTTSTSVCNLSGTTSAGGAATSLNGPTFGAPLPLLASNVPVCVVNRYKDPTITGTYNLQTGEGDGPVNLTSEVFLRQGQDAQVCPRCVNAAQFGAAALNTTGTCDNTSASPGAPCVVDGLGTVARGNIVDTYKLSSQCPPVGAPTASLPIPLNLTTASRSITGDKPCPNPPGFPAKAQQQNNTCELRGGVCNSACQPGSPACATQVNGQCIDTKGGISQLCCSNDATLPCFATGTGQPGITRTGTTSVPQPPWPETTYPKNTAQGQDEAYVATFCIAETGNILIDGITGLPGPGALILPATARVDAVQ